MPAWAIGLAAGAAVLSGLLCYGCRVLDRAVDGVRGVLDETDNPWDPVERPWEGDFD